MSIALPFFDEGAAAHESGHRSYGLIVYKTVQTVLRIMKTSDLSLTRSAAAPACIDFG
jgi:hypothetical protein